MSQLYICMYLCLIISVSYCIKNILRRKRYNTIKFPNFSNVHISHLIFVKVKIFINFGNFGVWYYVIYILSVTLIDIRNLLHPSLVSKCAYTYYILHYVSWNVIIYGYDTQRVFDSSTQNSVGTVWYQRFCS